jgi:DNA-binding response OmpR family regulator/two-component sensor histidine kinase
MTRGGIAHKPAIPILVVEDSRTQAEYLCHLLEMENYTALVAANGREALEILSKQLPALVLTDIVMPEMDGYDLCRKIKADPKTAGIPVILVTQLFDPADVLKGLESGADNFIVKPYDPEQVYSRITKTLESCGIPDPDGILPPFDVKFGNEIHRITSGRSRILNILLSTYEYAVRKNIELSEAHEEMTALNEEMTATVEEVQLANRSLTNENAERSRVEKALGDANRKLNLMTSVTRHDINNQIMALQAYIDLSEAESTDPVILQYMRKARGASQTIQKQIAFTKQYEDIGVKAPCWQDLREIIESLRAYLKGAGIELETHGLAVEIFADPLLPKVFENLVDNSIRHGRGVQHITISASPHADGSLVIGYRDDGAGVADEDKARIFQKGFGKNTGLGLFLSREILGITCIMIQEDGVPGKGAHFRIAVPMEGFRKSGAC